MSTVIMNTAGCTEPTVQENITGTVDTIAEDIDRLGGIIERLGSRLVSVLVPSPPATGEKGVYEPERATSGLRQRLQTLSEQLNFLCRSLEDIHNRVEV